MTDPTPMSGITRAGDAHVIKFAHTDVLQPASLHEVRSYISDLIKSGEPVKVVLDLDEVELISSEAIGLIVALRNTVDPQGGQLHVANVSERTYGVFEVTQLSNQLRIFNSTDEAIEGFT
jgi:anti-anti-sigma factor